MPEFFHAQAIYIVSDFQFPQKSTFFKPKPSLLNSEPRQFVQFEMLGTVIVLPLKVNYEKRPNHTVNTVFVFLWYIRDRVNFSSAPYHTI